MVKLAAHAKQGLVRPAQAAAFHAYILGFCHDRQRLFLTLGYHGLISCTC